VSGSTVTYWVILAAVGLLAAYDLFALTAWGPSDKVADVLKKLGFNYPILAFTAGVIVGHLLWPVLGDKKDDNSSRR